jgi:hypothetical protein
VSYSSKLHLLSSECAVLTLRFASDDSSVMERYGMLVLFLQVTVERFEVSWQSCLCLARLHLADPLPVHS